eukprot:TRINITY_DN110649_c0_g1_i1.p1 TRINITY_DN110649_c0_g1~~TRINITY_DN110649_c0_g1_i1.p1  ORF type:complete len:260 (-),score=47.08 TRINITY_DN110649_c0_g1_i1:104-784(-)
MSLEDKYQNFADNTMKDRLAFAQARDGTVAPPQYDDDDPAVVKSGFTDAGWDKYYFFSDPCQGTMLHPTARQGRNRPGMIGPQTFQTEAFSAEQVALSRTRLEKKGARTTYTDSYSQIPRSKNSMHGPIDEVRGHDLKGSLTVGVSSTLVKSASCTLGREPTAAELIAGPCTAVRHGPFWPPPGPERPDPVKVRANIFAGQHRTLGDAYARDRKAPGAMSYTLTRY